MLKSVAELLETVGIGWSSTDSGLSPLAFVYKEADDLYMETFGPIGALNMQKGRFKKSG
ncbi:MAG: hypothetical protein AAGD96_30165 [Chloroflexota bacterium]